jgi:hypothetical protein
VKRDTSPRPSPHLAPPPPAKRGEGETVPASWQVGDDVFHRAVGNLRYDSVPMLSMRWPWTTSIISCADNGFVIFGGEVVSILHRV